MRIAYDTQIFSSQEYGGVSRYFCALATEMSATPGVMARIVAPLHFNHYLRGLPRELVRGRYVKYLPNTGRLIRAASVLLSRPFLSSFKPHIIHETAHSSHPTRAPGVPRVITIHDMIHEKFPKYFPANDPNRRWKADSIARAQRVICISEQTRKDLLEHYDLKPEHVSVIYHGYQRLELNDEAISSMQVAQCEAWGGRPFLLYVGDRGGYKNFHGLLQAYAASDWLKENFSLVCFGGGRFRTSEILDMEKLGIGGRVFHLSGGDDRLAACYALASAFVYPSLYEGFGIPPLEAMSLGCPVICSRTSSIPEVVGEAGEYFDPYAFDSIRFALESVLQSPTRRQELVQRGAENCGRFSWKRCASETLDAYLKLVA